MEQMKQSNKGFQVQFWITLDKPHDFLVSMFLPFQNREFKAVFEFRNMYSNR